MAGNLDAIVIEDYGKGFVTAALVETVTRIAKEPGFLVTVDPSPGNPLSWRGADIVKPNRLEAFAAAGIEDSHSGVGAAEEPGTAAGRRRCCSKSGRCPACSSRSASRA